MKAAKQTNKNTQQNATLFHSVEKKLKPPATLLLLLLLLFSCCLSLCKLSRTVLQCTTAIPAAGLQNLFPTRLVQQQQPNLINFF
jgi:hypothetical protein